MFYKLRRVLVLLVGILIFGFPLVSDSFIPEALAEGSDNRFDKYEIRVIREKYFTKRRRLELGAQGLIIMNQTFIYTYMASGLLAYHFTEEFGIEASGAYGLTSDKQDKTTLKRNFGIRTVVLRTQYQMEGGLLWTPIYGKWQLPSGRLIYFDTFLAFGGGMTGVRYLYDQCDTFDSLTSEAKNANPDWVDPPPPTTKSYPTIMLGLGQRYFVDKNLNFKWDIRYRGFNHDRAMQSCFPDTTSASEGTELQHNVYVQLGASRFL